MKIKRYKFVIILPYREVEGIWHDWDENEFVGDCLTFAKNQIKFRVETERN